MLRYLLRADLIAGPAKEAAARFLRETSLPGAPPVLGFPGSVEFEDWNSHPAADPWKKARAALLRDASASLPD